MSCTGIRINEALSLTLGDIYLQKSLLFIRKGKFGKDRWISLATSTVVAINRYRTIRQNFCPGTRDDPLFINRFGKKLGYEQVRKTFRNLLELSQIHNKQSEGNIRLHDLRHTYATKCLLKWYQSGEDVNPKLPFLATAMGHVKISSTQMYLHITDQIRSYAHQRFCHKFQQNILKKRGSK
jgi:integrase